MQASETGRARPPAVAGQFYPADPTVLRRRVDELIGAVERVEGRTAGAPKALIVPHAGYVYSGPIAASGYAQLLGAASLLRRVVLIGPAHRVALRGLAVPSVAAFRTPLGEVPIETEAVRELLELPQVRCLDAPHADEHSLEVQLPFLQRVLEDFQLVPLVAGDATENEVAEVLERLWDGESTLIVVSSDLSHDLDLRSARQLDAATTRAIEGLEGGALGMNSACGRVPIRGLLACARHHHLGCRAIDLRTSGDSAGPTDRVVGYGAYVVA